MNLTDQETLALASLCDAVVDGSINETQNERLEAWLAGSLAARQFYVRSMALSASLHTYAGEMQSDKPDLLPFPQDARHAKPWKWAVSLALAASLAVGIWAIDWTNLVLQPGPASDEFVARLTGSKDCQWVGAADPMSLGDHLRRGQSLELAAGFAEFTFDSGAQLVLEGPGAIEMNSAWGITLHYGTLKALVPPQAIGFRVANPRVEVVDLGTEFTMIADGGGATEVLVLQGAVEAELDHVFGQESIVLRENEARRFSKSGVSGIRDGKQKFARYSQPLSLDRFALSPNYVHWTFDESEGGRFAAAATGGTASDYGAAVHNIDRESVDRVHVEGHRRGALNFSGYAYARAPFPGLSANGARTVAFWTKIPADAQLSDAYAMGAWLPASSGLEHRPIHISWNRNPEEGTMGALRTDYARGFAIGTTSLRDGAWHHVAVVFIPGSEADTPLQVNLYVDGHFEGEGRPSLPGRRIDSTKTLADYSNAVRDTLWLGCRLGSDGPRTSRFRGAMDELVVADRELAPAEIVQLMNENSFAPVHVVVDRIQDQQ